MKKQSGSLVWAINRWAYITIVFSVAIAIGIHAEYEHFNVLRRNLNNYYFQQFCLFVLLLVLTSPLGLVAACVFTGTFYFSGIFTFAEAIFVTAPVFCAAGWFQWYVLFPKCFRGDSVALEAASLTETFVAPWIPSRKKSLIGHLCIVVVASAVTALVVLYSQTNPWNVYLAALLCGFIYYSLPYFFWAIVAKLRKFSLITWNAGLLGVSSALTIVAAYWWAMPIRSEKPILYYWPLALFLSAALPVVCHAICVPKRTEPKVAQNGVQAPTQAE